MIFRTDIHFLDETVFPRKKFPALMHILVQKFNFIINGDLTFSVPFRTFAGAEFTCSSL